MLKRALEHIYTLLAARQRDVYSARNALTGLRSGRKVTELFGLFRALFMQFVVLGYSLTTKGMRCCHYVLFSVNEIADVFQLVTELRGVSILLSGIKIYWL
ncbi:hypothetical protein [Plesiomonas shigelloides]|uniref:hypothetical protein n=1 Tax=Plesiomonas shigelloides TaxID=703 RepID=UPI001261AD1F|nr:hypothetical protein [Plesiomonas shigelloides]KAB7702177.1 hypothetical protein GBN15_00560 [Plesiomonas shigelloides]